MSIKQSGRLPVIHAGLVLIAIFAVIMMGCVLPNPQGSSPQPAPATPAATAVPAAAATLESPAYVATGTTVPFLTANLPYGVTMSYPQNWEMKEVGTSDVRDYGQTTVNIANFFSPEAIRGDPESYTSMSIDIDQSVDTDLEQYFNLATVALGKYYGPSWDITKHSYQLKISDYKSYELDWQTKDERGLYIFTFAKGDVYIFSIKSPNKPKAAGEYSAEVEQMYKSVRLDPADVLVAKHR